MNKTTKLIIGVGACALAIIGITIAIPMIVKSSNVETTDIVVDTEITTEE